MDDAQKKAFEGATDLIKQLITLATGTVALTATFIKDILKIDAAAHIPCKPLLFVTWALMLLSIFCGLMAHGAITGTLDGAGLDPAKRVSPFDFNIRLWALSQCAVFYGGIVCLVIFVAITL